MRSNPYFIAELVPPSFSSALPSAPDLFAYQILIAVSALSLLLSLAVQVARLARGEGQPTGSGLGGAGGGHQAGALRSSLLATHLLIYGAFLYLSLLARRNVALFAVVAGPIAAIHLQEVAATLLRWVERRGGDAVPSFFRSLTVAAPISPSAPLLPGSPAPPLLRSPALLSGVGAAWRVFLALLLVALTWQVITDRYHVRGRTLRRFGLGVSELVYPRKAVDFILRADLPGNLFNNDAVGHYFTWRAYPRKKAFIDGTFPGGPDFVGSYREALRLKPRDAEIHFNLALAYRGKGLAGQEEAEYRRALELKPDFTQARLQLGLFYLRRGERAKANRELRQVKGGRGYHHGSHPLAPMAGGP